MNIRMARMRVIVNLLNAQIITSQEQLSAALLKQGYQTTQATLSHAQPRPTRPACREESPARWLVQVCHSG